MHAQSILGPLLLSSAAYNITNVLNPTTEAFIHNLLADWNSPGGIAVAVVKRDVEGAWNVETRGYGPAALDGRDMTEHTRFAIASNSKLFTVFATGLLIHNETISPRLSWTSKITPLIPEWHLKDPVATDYLTIIDAMSHRTGLPAHDMSYKLSDNTSTIFEKMKHLLPSTEFRETHQYSNLMYALLSVLPSRVLPSHPSFTSYVKEHILDRLGMNATSYDASGDVAEGVVRQFTEADGQGGNGTVRALPFDLDWNGQVFNAGAGGIVTNAVDMATWLRTLLSNGHHPDTGEVIIPSDIVEKVATGITVSYGKKRFPDLSPVVYGGGQTRSTYRGYELVEHSDGLPGHLSRITRFPDQGLGVMVYSNDNVNGNYLMETIRYRLVDEALGLEPIDWSSRFKEMSRQTQTSVSQPHNTTTINFTSAPLLDLEPGLKKLETLEGNYHNPGYGSFELCLFSPSSLYTRPSSYQCTTLATNAPTILPGAVPNDIPTFLTEWGSPWGTHLLFSHFAGNIYNITILSSIPTGNLEEPFWTLYGLAGEPSRPAWAEFDFEDSEGVGIGMVGVWGAGEGVPRRQGATARERAEAWFDRVGT